MNSEQDLPKSGDIQTLDVLNELSSFIDFGVEDKQMQGKDMLQYIMDDIDRIIADQLKDVDTDLNFRKELIAGLSFYTYALATPETLAVGRQILASAMLVSSPRQCRYPSTKLPT